ncbi:MAG: uracil-DNA glycosylase [Cyclobacteriaceae bacterium]|jgi:uracil-DNA glycosylase
MQVKIADSWKIILQPEFDKPYFSELISFIRQAYASTEVFPSGSKIFSAFDLCAFDQVQVVILGQDPYHGEGQAHGLCFSVNEGIPMPPSLLNIFKEIKSDVGLPMPANGNLVRWACQGVLLMNATLTVEAHKAGSHQKKGWERFTDAVIRKLSDERSDIVFLLWGSSAIKKQGLIDSSKHLVLTAPHPSPLSSYRGFFGCSHFSKTNDFLNSKQLPEILW